MELKLINISRSLKTNLMSLHDENSHSLSTKNSLRLHLWTRGHSLSRVNMGPAV